jgi:hypothetical protein
MINMYAEKLQNNHYYLVTEFVGTSLGLTKSGMVWQESD